LERQGLSFNRQDNLMAESGKAVRIAVDIMSGDYTPEEIVEEAAAASTIQLLGMIEDIDRPVVDGPIAGLASNTII